MNPLAIATIGAGALQGIGSAVGGSAQADAQKRQGGIGAYELNTQLANNMNMTPARSQLLSAMMQRLGLGGFSTPGYQTQALSLKPFGVKTGTMTKQGNVVAPPLDPRQKINLGTLTDRMRGY